MFKCTLFYLIVLTLHNLIPLKQRSESEDMNSTLLGGVEELKKSCTDCHTTRTPLWPMRGGPAGPRVND